MKNITNWNYERASWQWDLLCVLIMCFIFLTPKSWFNRSEGPAATRMPVRAVESIGSGQDVPPQGR